MFQMFPYTNAHQLNLDWILEQIKKLQISESAISSFNIFADIASSVSSLQEGDLIRTLGFYDPGDGGAGLYRIVSSDDLADYDLEIDSGLYAHPLFGTVVNAGAFGAIGDVGIAAVDLAIACAVSISANLVFPDDLQLADTIEIDSGMDTRSVTFLGNLVYTGTDAAIRVHNGKNITITGNKITAQGGIGLLYYQDQDRTIYNVNSKFNYIEAKEGVKLLPSTWGIYECEIDVDRIYAGSSGSGHCINLECVEGTTAHSSFIGQCKFKCQHLLNTQTYAIRMHATEARSTITGIYMDGFSMENSANGILVEGLDCKMIHLSNIRCLEIDSFTNILKTSGGVYSSVFHFATAVRDDKLDVESTVVIQSLPIIVSGGIISPTGFRFADEMIVGYRGNAVVRTYRSYTIFQRSTNSNFTFKENSNSYRCYTRIVNSGGAEIAYRDLDYFNPFGCNTLYITQNKTDGSVVKVYVGTALVFDGSTKTDTGVTTYKVTTMFDAPNSGIRYITEKLNTV